MADEELIANIHRLMDEEHRLRAAIGATDPERLDEIDVTLDQCWDLLRQRRARIDAGKNPDTATANSVDRVEGYLQ